jgi:hypothetical protein
MSSVLWNLTGEIAQELGYKDARGRHSTVIREMIAAAAAKWTHSPYVCRSERYTVYVTKDGSVFARQVQILRLNAPREKLPCFIEMKPEKREYYHRRHRELGSRDEHEWFLNKWLLNHFAVWNGKRDADDLELFQQEPLSSHVDSFGTTYKSADLAVHAISGRFLTRETVIGLVDYVQWKEPKTSTFDRYDIPIDIPTTDLEVSVVVDRDLFAGMDVQEDGIANLSLEFRNRESARFEGKEVALYPEIGITELYGRASSDEGVDEGGDQMLGKVRRLRQRVSNLLTNKASIRSEAPFDLPQNFLFYRLRWPSPHLGIEACVRWEKPARKEAIR